MPEVPDNVTLRDLVQSELRRIDEKIQIQNASIGEATRIATAALDKRLEGMNEFRQQMSDWAARYSTRSEIDIKMDAMNQRVAALEKTMNNLQGRLWAVAAVIVVIELALRFFNH